MPLAPQFLMINYNLLSRRDIRTYRTMPTFRDYKARSQESAILPQSRAIIKDDYFPQTLSESLRLHSLKHLVSSLLKPVLRKRSVRERFPPEVTWLGQHSI